MVGTTSPNRSLPMVIGMPGHRPVVLDRDRHARRTAAGRPARSRRPSASARSWRDVGEGVDAAARARRSAAATSSTSSRALSSPAPDRAAWPGQLQGAHGQTRSRWPASLRARACSEQHERHRRSSVRPRGRSRLRHRDRRARPRGRRAALPRRRHRGARRQGAVRAGVGPAGRRQRCCRACRRPSRTR